MMNTKWIILFQRWKEVRMLFVTASLFSVKVEVKTSMKRAVILNIIFVYLKSPKIPWTSFLQRQRHKISTLSSQSTLKLWFWWHVVVKTINRALKPQHVVVLEWKMGENQGEKSTIFALVFKAKYRWHRKFHK